MRNIKAAEEIMPLGGMTGALNKDTAWPNVGRCDYLSIDELYDVLLASQALQQGDLIHKASAGLRVFALQLDALQGKDLAVWCHYLSNHWAFN